MQLRLSIPKAATGLMLAALLALPWRAGATPADEARAAEALVRRTYYEGLPVDAARAITPAGAERLAALLADPAERANAAKIALALGIAARPGAFEALERAADAGASGELDRAAYRLLDAVPIAMGWLARSDDRAFAWLVARAATRGADPGWSHGPFAGQRLADQQRRRAIAGLALSGRAEVPALLDRIEHGGAQARSTAAADPELAGAIDSARSAFAGAAR
jgi:hypothetical protein